MTLLFPVNFKTPYINENLLQIPKSILIVFHILNGRNVIYNFVNFRILYIERKKNLKLN